MQSEVRLQQEIVLWFNNYFPALRGCLCYNNNNSVGGRRAMLNKFLGIVKGRSDLVLYYNGHSYHIELKTLKGVQSKEQRNWQLLMEQHTFKYNIVRTLDEFKALAIRIVNDHI